MPSLTFLRGFCQYAWYRSGPLVAVATVTVIAVTGVNVYLPGLPFPARVPLDFVGLFFLLGMLDALTFSDREEVGNSSFPKQFYLLPAPTIDLVLAPMAFGAALMVLLGAVIGFGLLTPSLGIAQAWWPIPYLTGCLCFFQALAWKSFPHAAIRVVVGLLPVAAVIVGPLLEGTGVATPWQVGLAYAALIPLSVGTAIRSVGRSRGGETSKPWRLPDRMKARPPFKSPMEAQVWLEVRRNGFFTTVLISFLTAVLVVIGASTIHFSHDTIMINGTSFGFQAIVVPLMLLYLGTSAGLGGCCASVTDNVTQKFELVPFLALRPLSTAQLIEAKMRMAAIVLFRCTAILLIGVLALLLIPATANPAGRPTLFVLAEVLTWKQASVGSVLYCGLVVGTGKGMISGIWSAIGLLHPYFRASLSFTLPLVVIVLLGMPVYLFADPAYIPRVVTAMPYAIGAVLILKFALAGLSVRQLRQRHLVSDRTIIGWLVAWLSFGLILIVALAPFRSLLGLSLTTIAFAQLLTLPIGRAALTPILVSANRHR
jgi:hypothetical protein